MSDSLMMKQGGNTTTTSTTSIGSKSSEMEIILPPPSDKNPIPSLSAALRVDNYEQVVQLLSLPSTIRSITTPNQPSLPTTSTPTTTTIPQPQFLLFGTASLRTLILRHVLNDPQQSSFSSSQSISMNQSSSLSSTAGGTNHSNSTSSTPTTFPHIPRHLNVIGTGLLDQMTTTPSTTTITEGGGGGATTVTATHHMDTLIPHHTNVITYFLRPTDLVQTQKVCDFIVQYQRNHRSSTNNSTTSGGTTKLTPRSLASSSSSSGMVVHHRIVYIPQIPTMVHKLLTNAGLIGSNSNSSNTSAASVTVHSLSLDLFPLESDVLSMEFPDAFRELHIEGTPSTIITYIARSLLKLQDIVGTIPRIQSYGVASEQVVRKALDMTVEEYYAAPHTSATSEGDERSVPPSETVAALIVLDRKIDMVTPLVTPLTYEGLLDDVVGIANGCMNVNVDVINPPDENQPEPGGSSSPDRKQNSKLEPPKSKVVTLAMNETDTMFSEIRDQHVEQFGSYLQQQAKSMQAQQNDFKATGKQKELSELHQFVKQLPHMKQKFQYLTTHIHLAELIKSTTEQSTFRERWQMERTMLEGDTCFDELDDLVAMSYPLYRFLRLLCLQSICKNGINASRYDSIRKDFVQTYGYEFVGLLVNLEKAGLLRRKEAFLGIDKASAFSKVKDLLVLINAEVDTIEPDDISYVSSGYAPLTVRLLQSAVTGWKNGRDDILREIPGRFIDIMPLSPPEDLAVTMQRPVHTGGSYGSLAPPPLSTNTTMTRASRTKPVLIVVYLGGVTYMELTALRFLSKRSNFPYHIICCTTSILNGTTFLQSLA